MTDMIAPAITIPQGNHGRSFYADQSGQFDAGYWECDVNKHHIAASPYDECVYLLEGQIDVIHDDGSVESYKTGNSFVVPRGCNCTWDVKARSAQTLCRADRRGLSGISALPV